MARESFAGLDGGVEAVPRRFAFASGHETQAESFCRRLMLSFADFLLGELLMDPDVVEAPQRALQGREPRGEFLLLLVRRTLNIKRVEKFLRVAQLLDRDAKLVAGTRIHVIQARQFLQHFAGACL